MSPVPPTIFKAVVVPLAKVIASVPSVEIFAVCVPPDLKIILGEPLPSDLFNTKESPMVLMEDLVFYTISSWVQ